MIKGVVFDFDGVLVDTPKIYFETMGSFLRSHGLNLSREELSRLIAYSMKQEFGVLREKYSLNVSFDEFMKGTLVHSRKIMENRLEMHVGAKKLLLSLYEKDFSIGLASNNNRSIVDWVLNRFGLKKFFDCVVPVELVSNPKPAPDIYLKSAELLALKPLECVGIEDSVVGCQSVMAAGFKCIAFPNEFSPKEQFKGVDLMVGSLAELSVQKILSLGEKQ